MIEVVGLTGAFSPQVLAESLRVLTDIQSLICEELQLPPGSMLDEQPAEIMSRVSAPLLGALEVREWLLHSGIY